LKPISDILRPLEDDFQVFHSRFSDYLKSDTPLLDKILQYILRQKGKQIRPALVLLSSHLTGGINEKSYRGAILVELLHTATLVHDDVVDDADMRRSLPSVNALWKNKIAVLIGDYLLSRGLLLSLNNQDFSQLAILSRAVKEMSEGELIQIEKSRLLNTTEEVYFKIIQGKTASLISSGCEIGGLSNTSDPEILLTLRNIGHYLGLAFQIRDDVFDYMINEDDIGKPIGLDIKEKKLTLPLIYALDQSSESEKKAIKKLIESGKKAAEFLEIVDFIRQKRGVDYSNQVAYEYAGKAKAELMKFPESEYRTSFSDLIDFVITRTR